MTTTGMTVDAAVHIGGKRLALASCFVMEGISRLTQARLEVASTEYIDAAALVGETAKLELLIKGSTARSWTLVTGRVSFIGAEEGSLRYELELFCPLWLLRHTKSIRKFRNLSSQEIVTKVLSEGGIAHSWQITRTPPTRKYCVQYRESNLDFVERLLEFEGIYYTTDASGTLILEDSSSLAPPIEGESTYDLLSHAGSLEGELGIHSFGKGRRVGTGTATVNDFSWKTPKVNLLQSQSAAHDPELEWYDYPTGYRKAADGAYLAQIRLEAFRVPTSYVKGAGNAVTFEPGHTFTFEGEQFGGDYLLTQVVHEVHDPAYGAKEEAVGQTTYRNNFEAIPAALPYRPPMVTPHPKVQGVHTAMVRGPAGEEIHTDKYGRFRAQFHWDREAKSTDEDSRWLRKLQESTTSMNLARIGWEVSVAYIDGDPDRPIGLARDINGAMVPSYGQPGNKETMTIKTPTYPANGGFNEIKLVDTAGSQLMYWKAEKDLVNTVENDKTEKIGNDETHYVGAGFRRGVEHDQTVTIGGNSTFTVASSYQEQVTKDRSETVGGNTTITTGGLINEITGANDTESVGSVRLTVAGTFGSAGVISRNGTDVLSRSVGGAFVAASADNIMTNAQKLLFETVGGAKITAVADGSIKQGVDGHMMLTVGGAVFRLAGEDMGIGGENNIVTVGGLAQFESAERNTIQAREIALEADSDLKLTSNDLEIDLQPGVTAVKGKIRIEAGNSVTVTGKDDNLTK